MFIIFWFFCAVCFALLWSASALVFFVGLKRKSEWLKCIGGASLFGLTGIAAIVVGITAWSFLFPPSPAQHFEGVFGFAPPADVKELRSADPSFGDYGALYLSFEASPATIKRITSRGYKRSNQAQDSYGEPPEWWKPILSQTTISYLGTVKPGAFASEEVVLHYDTRTQIAHYEYTGID
jgi:hypothetical protein